MNELRRQTALVTGASSGIGLDLAKLFAANRYDLVLVARSEGKLRDLAATMEHEHGIRVIVMPADLAKPDAARELVQQLTAQRIEIDALVNNAGFGTAGAFISTSLEMELQMIQVNITALTHLTKLLLPPMIARRSGRIMNVASTAAFQPGPLMAVYYATKAYVLSFSEALAEESRKSGVTVTALCPGPTATGFADVADMNGTRLFKMSAPMTSAEVAKIGYAAMMRGKRVAITGLRNKLTAQSIRFTPRRLVTTIVRKLQENG